MRALVAVLLSAVLVGCSTSAPKTAPTPVGREFPAPAVAALDDGQAAAKLQAVLDEVVALFKTTPGAETAARGVTAAVIVGDRWSWTGAAGADALGETLRPSTEMATASITKTFVAAEVLRLAEAGRIDLNAPLSRYVKHRLTANGATVRQYLAMTAGVPDFLPSDYEKMAKDLAGAPARRWTARQALKYHTSAPRKPGSPYSYSNASYLLVGMAIEAVTKKPLALALRNDLVKPAGLRRIAFQDGERPQEPIAGSKSEVCGTIPDGFIPCRSVASSSAAAGSMAADAATVARWGYQLYGARVLPAAIVDQLISGSPSGSSEYGLGTMRFSSTLGPLGDAFGHRGNAPGYTSLLAVIPTRRLSVAVLLADGNKNVDAVMTKFLTALAPLVQG
ncbi:serine hydrolase domain-containing protein [Kribbella deserti]|uniref:Serine hydrolase domain-containing protein n=1 Tax=Kribbella deserti TaxID=1926257 RepID=A0ABV6QKZ2_9ACTN